MRVQILMSTYNGEQYIRTQLESIVNQDIEKKSLLIRDDGSSDNTVGIIEEFAQNYPWIKYYCGKNIGSRKSFMELLYNSDPDAAYIALADQDDLWLPEKLRKAQMCLENSTLNGKKIPLLYCGDKQIVGRNLEKLDVHVERKVRKISFGNALVQNICTGCTAVMNQELATLIKEYRSTDLENMIMHDWWLYLVASCFGRVYYDTNAYILYRQHGNNVYGAMIGRRDLLRYRISQLSKPRGEIYQQAEMFWEIFQTKLEEPEYVNERKMIRKFLESRKHIMGRGVLASDRHYYRQKWSDDIVFRLIVLLGKL